MKLELKIIRKKYFKILLSMTIIISLGVALLFGLINGVLSLQKSVDNFIEENNYPDIKIITEKEDIEKISKLDQENFKNIEYRLSISTIIYKGDDILSVKLNTYDDKYLNNFYVYEQKENNSDYYDIFVDKRFANNNNIKTGDTLKIKVDENFYNFFVTKIISIPEAIVSTPINGIWGEVNDYGNLYINRKVLLEETNKTKNKLLNELLEKENDLLNEESKKEEDYKSEKDKINSALKEYNSQKKYYKKIQEDLNNKKIELNKNKEKLKEVRKEYINITNTIKKYEDVIDSYIDIYNSSVDKSKEYIDKIIEEKYQNIKEEELETITKLAYYIIQGKIDELSSSNDEIKDLVHEVMNDYIKLDELKPLYKKFVDIIDNTKDKLKSTIEKIYNCNKKGIEKAKLISNEVFDYIQEVLDEGVLLILSEYKDNLEGNPITVIDKLIAEIDNGLKDIADNNKIINDKLKKAYKLINTNSVTLDDIYDTLKEEISKTKDELNDKKIEINQYVGDENKFNEILINLDSEENNEEVLNYIKDNCLEDIEVLNSYTYENSPVYNHINNNINSMKTLASIIPTVFYIVILIVLYLFIILMIRQSKKDISILRLLGKTNNSIRFAFCINNLIVALCGIIFGIIMGFFPMIYMVEYYKKFFYLPQAIYTVDISVVLLCLIITIIVVEIATIIATRELDKISPVEILKREVFQNREISKFSKAITSKFKPFIKFNIFVYIRNKSKLLLGIICTSMTVAIIFSSLSYIASKNKIINTYFNDRIHYDAQIFKSGDITNIDLENIRELYYVKNADLLRLFNVKIKNNNKEQNIVINALDNTNNYIKIWDKNNREIKYPENGIVLEEHIANNLGLKINDIINIEGIDFKIVDISFQSLGRVNYISLKDSYKLKSTFDTIILNMDTRNEKNLVNKLAEDDNYIYSSFVDKLKDYNMRIFDSYTLPSIIIIIFTLIIGYMIIINLNIYNLLNQRKNLSLFRSLGFQYNEISRNWFAQSLIQSIISIIIGIPCGILLSRYFLNQVSGAEREFIYANGYKEYLFTILFLLVYIYIGHRKTMHSFRKMDIVEEMKERD